MLNDLLLLSGNDIPFESAQISIHQPTIKEIAYIGEEAFFIGCELLNFSKEVLSIEDKTNLENKTNFEVFMSIMIDKRTLALQKSRTSAILVLTLLFPSYEIKITKDFIEIKKDEEIYSINNNNFEEFKEILVSMFCLKSHSSTKNFNPLGEQAKAIADKLNKGRAKIANEKKEKQKIAILSRYISILAVGETKSINDLLQYTVYQLFDEFERYELKQSYDVYFQAKLVGAKDLKEVESWMKDIHS